MEKLYKFIADLDTHIDYIYKIPDTSIYDICIHIVPLYSASIPLFKGDVISIHCMFNCTIKRTIKQLNINLMENTFKYESPTVEVIEIAVEQGFANSNGSTENYNTQPW